jgi:hypothetical protein
MDHQSTRARAYKSYKSVTLMEGQRGTRNQLFYILLSNQAAHEAEKGQVEARALARESELKALKARVGQSHTN